MLISLTWKMIAPVQTIIASKASMKNILQFLKLFLGASRGGHGKIKANGSSIHSWPYSMTHTETVLTYFS